MRCLRLPSTSPLSCLIVRVVGLLQIVISEVDICIDSGLNAGVPQSFLDVSSIHAAPDQFGGMGMSEQMWMGMHSAGFAQSTEEVNNGSIGHGAANHAIPKVDKDIIALYVTELVKEVIGV
jgi:hypothetical protein